jgi:hypothetical protein
VDNGSETVQRVKGAAEYYDHLEARSLIRGRSRRAWDSNPQVLSDNGFQAISTTSLRVLHDPEYA